jgi:hypothetical protein
MQASAKSAPKAASVETQPAPAPVRMRPTDEHYRPGRSTKTNVTGYFSPEVKKQLRVTAAEQGRTIQDLLAEALNSLFASYGKPEIAEGR